MDGWEICSYASILSCLSQVFLLNQCNWFKHTKFGSMTLNLEIRFTFFQEPLDFIYKYMYFLCIDVTNFLSLSHVASVFLAEGSTFHFVNTWIVRWKRWNFKKLIWNSHSGRQSVHALYFLGSINICTLLLNRKASLLVSWVPYISRFDSSARHHSLVALTIGVMQCHKFFIMYLLFTNNNSIETLY